MQFHEESLEKTCRKYNAILCLVLLICGGIAQAEVHTFGGKTGWGQVPVRNGVTIGKGRFGFESLELESNASQVMENTDCLINFEDGAVYDHAGHYQVVKNSTFASKKANIGKGSVMSRGRGGIELKGDDTSFFGYEGPAGSFVIDFWINPSTVENGETILSWRSSKSIAGQVVYQLISTSFYKNKVLTLFSNIFEGWSENHGDVTLTSSRSIIPNKWSHHVIYFEDETGILEYRIDGVLEDIKFLTDTGHEGGSVYPAVMGVGANLHICPSYTGLIDDFMILRSYANLNLEEKAENSLISAPEHYRPTGGHFESIPVLVKEGTIINRVKAEVSEPSQTDVKLFVRAGDNYFNWTSDYPEWFPVKNGEQIQGLSGMYFQVAGELYPDGGAASTPSVTQIDVEYTELPEPLPPYKVHVEKGDGKVTLTWSYSVDDTAGGYYIYYGNRPGEYLGRIAAEGPSPINAGNVTSYTLTGLKNGAIYYFAISTYSKLDSRICGPLSKEVFARPEHTR